MNQGTQKHTPQQRWHQFREDYLPQLSRRQQWAYGSLAIMIIVIFVMLILPFLLPLAGDTVADNAQLADDNGNFLLVNGVRIYYQRINGAGEQIILIHGQAGSTLTWKSTMPALAAAGYDVLAFDLPGYGLSQKGYDLDFSHAFAVDLLISLMDALNIGQTHLVAHAFGGNIALFAAQENPDRIKSLSLVAPTFFDYSPPSVPETLLNTFFLERWWRISLRWILPEAVGEQLRSATKFDNVVDEGLIADYSRLMRTENWEYTALGVIRDNHRNGLPDSLENTRQPIALLWGTEDGWAAPDAADGMLEKFPNASLFSFEGAGHLPMHEVPEEFNAVLINFLDNQEQ